MKYAIEINSWTIDLIEKLNDGVRPSPQTLMTPHIYVWSSEDSPNLIIEEHLYRDNYNFVALADVSVVEWRPDDF